MPLFLVVDDTSRSPNKNQNQLPCTYKLCGYVGFCEEVNNDLIDNDFCKYIYDICSKMIACGATLKEISAEISKQINNRAQKDFSVVEWVDIKKEKYVNGSAEPNVEYYYEWNKIEKNKENE